MPRRRPAIPLLALKDNRLSKGDLRVLFALDYLRDSGAETCTADGKTIGALIGASNTRVSEHTSKLSKYGYITKKAAGRGLKYAICWDLADLETTNSSSKTGTVKKRNSSGKTGRVPDANGSGFSGTVEAKTGTVPVKPEELKPELFQENRKSDSLLDNQISDSDQIGSDKSHEKLKNGSHAASILQHYRIPEFMLTQDAAQLQQMAQSGVTVSQLHRACVRASNINANPGSRYILKCAYSVQSEDSAKEESQRTQAEKRKGSELSEQIRTLHSRIEGARQLLRAAPNPALEQQVADDEIKLRALRGSAN